MYDLVAANGTQTNAGSWTFTTPTGWNATTTVEDIAMVGNYIFLVTGDTATTSPFRKLLVFGTTTTNASTRTTGNYTVDAVLNLDAANSTAKGLTASANKIWVTNDSNNAVYVYNWTAPTITLAGSWLLNSANADPADITNDPSGASTNLWVLDNVDKLVYTYSAATAWTSGSAAPTMSGTIPLAYASIDPQGIADPPPVANKFWKATVTSGQWENANNWVGNTLPTSSDNVSIPAGATVSISSSISVNSVQGSGTITIDPASGFTDSSLTTLADSAMGRIDINSGALHPLALMTVNDLRWNEGGLVGSGTTVIPVGGTANIAAGVETKYLLDGHQLNNYGTISWRSNVTNQNFFNLGFSVGSAPVSIRNEAGGTINFYRDQFSGDVGTQQFNSNSFVSTGDLWNFGTINQVSDVSAYQVKLEYLVHNSGTITAFSGGVNLSGGLSNNLGGTVDVSKFNAGRVVTNDYFMGAVNNSGTIRVGNGTVFDGIYDSMWNTTQAASGVLLAGTVIVGRAIDGGAIIVNQDPPVPGSLVNSGQIIAKLIDVRGDLTNNLGGFIQAGRLIVGSEGGTGFVVIIGEGLGGVPTGTLRNHGRLELLFVNQPGTLQDMQNANTSTAQIGFENTGTLVLAIQGSSASQRFSRIKVLSESNLAGSIVGAVKLGGGLEFNVAPSVLPAIGESYILVEKVVTGAASGAFSGFPEGGAFRLNGEVMRSRYQAGTGNNDFWITNTGPYITIDDPFLVEGDAAAGVNEYSDMVFQVRLDEPSNRTVAINYATTDLEAIAGIDYLATSGVLTIPAGSKVGTIAVPIKKDLSVEQNERFSLRLSSPTNSMLQKPGGIGSILSDDNEVSARDSRGKEFLFVFTNSSYSQTSSGSGEYNAYVAGPAGTNLNLFVTRLSSPATPIELQYVIPAEGFLEINIAHDLEVLLNNGQFETLLLPDATGVIDAAMVNLLKSSSFRLVSSADVSLYGASIFDCGTTSSSIFFPNDVLGGEYRVMSSPSVANGDELTPFGGSEISGGLFAVMAAFDDTLVTITPTASSGSFSAGFPTTITLNRGQVFQYIANSVIGVDVTGSLVASDKPISVISGHQYARILPNISRRDTLMESMLPVNTLGREFIIADTKRDPFAGAPVNPDTFRVLATQNGTIVRLNGVVVASIDAGQAHEFQFDGHGVVKTNKPALVAQMTDGAPGANMGAQGSVTYSMPSMMIVPPYEQFLADYTIAVPSFFPVSYVNIVTPTVGIQGLRLDGATIDANQFQAVPGSDYSVARILVSSGDHRLTGALPFGVNVYGFESHNAHAYLGGISLSPVKTVSAISLTPPTDKRPVTTPHTVKAKISNDLGIGVPGIRVDFFARGVNDAVGAAFTDLRGEATFEYVGSSIGKDVITAVAGQLSSQANVEWSVAPPTISVKAPTDGSEFETSTPILLSGSARAGQSGVTITRVTIDGVPVAALDAVGNFFEPITVGVGPKSYLIEAFDSYGQSASTTWTVNGTSQPDRGLDTRGLIEVEKVKPDYYRTSFDADHELLYTDVRFTNRGAFGLEKPLYVGVKNLSNPLVVPNGFDGFTEDGVYYWNYADLVTGETLDTSEQTGTKSISFHNPSRTQFTFDWVILSNPNDPPRFTSIPVMQVRAGLQYKYTPQAIDPEGHIVSLSLASGPTGLLFSGGQITWNTIAADVGTYPIEVAAQDSRGAKTIQSYILEVLPPSVNRAPVFISAPVAFARVGQEYKYVINARDPDGDTVTLSAAGVTGLTVVGNTLTWTPTASQVGSQTIILTATDGILSSTQEFVVAVDMALGNKAPQIVSDARTKAAQNQVYRYQVKGFDPDQDPLIFSLERIQNGASVPLPPGLQISADGLIQWASPDPLVTPLNLRVSAADGRGGIGIQNFTLNILPANLSVSGKVEKFTTSGIQPAPGWTVFLDQNLTGRRESAEVWTTTDANGNYSFNSLVEDIYSIRVERQPRWFVDTPDTGERRVTLLTNATNQNFTVSELPGFVSNRAPVLTAVPTLNAQPTVAFTYTLSAVDEDGDKISYGLMSAPDGMIIHPDTGVVTWTPSVGWSGKKVRVLAGAKDPFGGLDSRSFEINVQPYNHPPVIFSQPPLVAKVGSPYRYEVSAKDPEGTVLQYDKSGPSGLEFSPTGIVTWTPQASQEGFADVVLTVADGQGAQTQQSFRILVVNDLVTGTGNNRPPVFTSAPVAQAKVGAAYTYTPTASDPDAGDTWAIQIVEKPSWLGWNSGVLSGTPGAGDITPGGEFGGTVTLRVTDSHGASRTQSYKLLVVSSTSAVSNNRAPIITASPQRIAVVGAAYQSDLTLSDPDGDTVSLRPIGSLPAWMSLSVVPGVANTYRLFGRPSEQHVGPVDVQFAAVDSNGATTEDRWTLTVVMPNLPPTVDVVAPNRVTAGSRWIGRINAKDINGDPVSFNLINPPSPGISINEFGIIQWPTQSTDANANAYQINVQVSDGVNPAIPVTISLTVTNDKVVNTPPTIVSSPGSIVGAGRTYVYNAKATDPDNDTLWWSLEKSPQGAVIDPVSGTLQWTPTPMAGQSYEFVVAVSDLKTTTRQSFTVTVPDRNRPPVVQSTPPSTGKRGNIYEYGLRAIDEDLDPLTFSLLTPTLQIGEKNPLTENAQINSQGLIRWKPQQVGIYRFRVKVDDLRGGIAYQEFVVNVADQTGSNNLSPEFVRLPSGRGIEGRPYVSPLLAVDPDGDAVTYSFVALASGDLQAGELDPFALDNGGQPINSLVLPTNAELNTGLLAWTPKFAKPYRFKLQAADAFGGSTTVDVVVKVVAADNSSNTAPSIISAPLTSTVINEEYSYDVAATDADGDPIAYSLVAPSALQPGESDGRTAGVSFDSSTGLLQFTPKNLGKYRFRVRAEDDRSGQVHQEFVVEVLLPANPGNQPPAFTTVAPSRVKADTTFVYNSKAVDPEGQAVTYALLSSQALDGQAAPTQVNLSTTGVLTWPVPAGASGRYRFRIEARDPVLGSQPAIQDFIVTVVGAGTNNAPPRFDFSPQKNAIKDVAFTDQALAFDPDGDVVTYSVSVGGAEGITINPNTGVINWPNPTLANNLTHRDVDVELKATDSFGAPSTYRYVIRIAPPNRLPTLEPVNNQSIYVGNRLALDLVGGDPDVGQVVQYSVTGLPNATVNALGQLRWDTNGVAPGVFNVEARVTDPFGLFVLRPFTVTVLADNVKPQVSIATDPESRSKKGDAVSIVVTASDNVAVSRKQLEVQLVVGTGQPAPGSWTTLQLDATGKATYTPTWTTNPGGRQLWIRGTAYDASGNVQSEQKSVSIYDPDVNLPVINLNSIGSTPITDRIAIVGSIMPNGAGSLSSWKLQYLQAAAIDGADPRWITFASDSVQQSGAGVQRAPGSTLGTFDPTLLENGNYQIRLIAYNNNEESIDAYANVEVEGQLKLGNFNVSFTDMEIPLGGIPIEIVRTYDSSRANIQGDFGNGWFLDVKKVKPEIDRSTTGSPGFRGYAAFEEGTRINVTLEDGTTEGFTFRALPGQTLFGVVLSWRPNFDPDPTNTYLMEVPQVDLYQLGSEYMDGGGATYTPEDPLFGGSVTLSGFLDKMKSHVDLKTGEITAIEDRHKNRLDYEDEGILGSRGRSVEFERDWAGRITKITDPRGGAVTYQYDAMGRLITFRDRMQTAEFLGTGGSGEGEGAVEGSRLTGEGEGPNPNAPKYSYSYLNNPEYPNYLDEIRDPFEQVQIKATYALSQADQGTDKFGRVTATTDAQGHSIGMQYNLATRTTTETNQVGSQTVTQRDPRGNATMITANGQTSLAEYLPGTDLSTKETIVIGLLDSPQNGETDDKTVTRAYNALGQPISETDENGQTSTSSYDGNGNQTSTTDENGDSTEINWDEDDDMDWVFFEDTEEFMDFAWDAAGDLFWSATGLDVVYDLCVEYCGTVGGVLADGIIQMNTFGLVTKDDITNLLGAGSSTPSNPDMSSSVGRAMEHNEFGDLTKTTDSRGNVSTFTHDLNGNELGTTETWVNPQVPSQTVSVVNSSTYNANDDGSVSTSFTGQSLTTYDAMGREYQSTDEIGMRAESVHDTRGLVVAQRTEAGRQTVGQTTVSTWMESRTVYDAAGRVTFQTKSYPESYFTDPTKIPLIEGTKQEYDTAGRVTKTSVVRGLEIQITGANGTAVSSKPTANNPQELYNTRRVYSTDGRVLSAFDAFNRESQFLYNFDQLTMQARTQTVDSQGVQTWTVVRTKYDDKGRVLFTTDPYLTSAATSETAASPTVYVTKNIYDAKGRIVGTERIKDAIVSVSSDGKDLVLTNPGTVILSSEVTYDRHGRAYLSKGSDGQIQETIFYPSGRVRGSVGTRVPASEVGLSQYAGKMVRQRSEIIYDRNHNVAEQWSNILQIEELQADGSYKVIDIDYSQKLVGKSEFDQYGRATKATAPDGSTVQFEYNSAGLISAEIDPLGRRREMKYDSQRRLESITLPGVKHPTNPAITDLVSGRWKQVYDNQGRVTSTIDNFMVTRDGNNVETELNDHNGVAGNDTRTSTVIFDAEGRLEKRVLPNGLEEKFFYDSRGRLDYTISFEGVYSRTVYDDSFNGGGRVSMQKYYPGLTQFNNDTPDEVLTFSYDGFGRTVGSTHLRSGLPTDSYSSKFDDQGRLILESSPTGDIRYDYDTLGRKTHERVYASGAGLAALSNPVDSSIQTVEYEYDTLSRLKTVKTIRRDSAEVDRDNNPANGLQSENTSYTYDHQGRVFEKSLPNGVLEVFRYDAMSRLIERSQKLASDPATVLSQFTYSYDPDNNPTTTGTDGKRYRATEKTRVQPTVGPAELRTSEYVWTYDGAGRMVKEVLDHWDNLLDHTEDYLYDLVGNRVKKTTDNPNTAGVDSVTTYTYNQNDQAIAEFVDLGGDNVVDETISYTWQGTQQTSKTTTVNSVNVDKVQFTYNLRGQLSRVTTETRNASNQLTKNTQVNYRYDIAGIRNVELSYNDANLDGSFATNEKSGSISYTINHQSMTGVAEVLIETHRDGNDNLVKRVSYTFAEDELTQTTTEYNPANGQQTSKTTLTFGHDGHGSVRAVFGASAALLQAFTYAAYGELLAVHTTTGQSVPVAQSLTRMLYSGEATDPNTGMQYLRARWYDTNSGRFATLDPHGGLFENPLTMNKYAYTSGDPISYNDPTGEFEGLAGMMSSMGNMMANFGMRRSQNLRSIKTARIITFGKS